ncbi:MAG: flagellar M-ring protein FliF [Acidobacteria bacterium]|nr:flagellar M-ring protein FliF [Acidobacteriota bacterium]
MPGNRPNFVNQLLEMWSRLLWPQRLSILFFGLLGIVLIGSVVYFMNRVEYEPLYRDLDPEDAKAIADKLDSEKRKYIVRGTSILVAGSENEINKLRMDISGSGLGRSGKIGYEIFDKNQFGMTDFTEQVNLQRALEGELARTICSLTEIHKARVHIVLPKDSLFEEKAEAAKASVVLTLKQSAELSKSSVAGIKGVVAGAVPGLRTHNVSIVDDEGHFLSQSVESGDAARAEMESGIREQLEREMAGKVVSILEPLVGKGNVHANASIALDFNTTEQTEETINPNSPVILSQQKSEERAGNSGGPSGIPGTQSNLGMNVPQSSGSAMERVRQSEVTNYEVSKTVRHTIQPKGTVQRLSVAVILDHKTIYQKAKDGKVSSRLEPRSQKDLDAYRELVLAAVGYDAQRGDLVTIENVPFYSESRPEEPQPATPWYVKRQVYLMPAMKYGSLLILFLLVYFIIFRPIRKRAFQAISYAALGPGVSGETLLAGSEGAAKALPGATHPEEIAAAGAGGVAGSLPAGEGGLGEEEGSIEAVSDEQIERELMKEASAIDTGGRKFAAMKKKLVDKAKKDPEMVSQLIRSLLRERV